MALRMVEIFHPKYALDDVRAVLEDVSAHGVWEEFIDDETVLTRVLVEPSEVDEIFDRLRRRTENNEGFRIVLIPVEATLPRIEDQADSETELVSAGPAAPKPAPQPAPRPRPAPAQTASRTAKPAPAPSMATPPPTTDVHPTAPLASAATGSARAATATGPEPQKPVKKGPKRIAKEELMADLRGGFSPDSTHVVLVILSAIVAAVGLVKNNVAVLVGAMVIAPLLGPNMALSLATTLGDTKLVKRALWTNIVGFTLALGLATLLGIFLPNFDEAGPEILSRTKVAHSDLILALAAGAAGALAFTSGAPAGLIGVMVAVALMPPLVVAGLFLGRGEWTLSMHAFELVAANVICVNLTGVATFWIKGIRPRVWHEAERARRSFWIAVSWWSTLLAILIAVIVLN